MVTVKSPATRSSRLVAHYLLLGGATCFLCMTVFLLSSPSSSLKGVRAHSAHDWVTRPHLIYGTAWKKEETARLVSEAIHMGFRYVDTACQPKHYNEAGVGNGWTAAAQELGLVRKDLWLQTKFTPLAGQDPNNVPYDRSLPVDEQAKESLQVSLTNLKTDYLDSWVLHSNPGSFEDLMRVWRVMEEAVDQGRVHMIGISNIYDLDTFRLLYQQARHKPSFLQNRFHAETNFDTPLRHFCKDHGVSYQSFWTLTANRDALKTSEVTELAKAKGLTAQTYMFAFLMSLKYITPLSGTTSRAHMAEDVAVMERMQGGETILTEHEQRLMVKLLGMPKL